MTLSGAVAALLAAAAGTGKRADEVGMQQGEGMLPAGQGDQSHSNPATGKSLLQGWRSS
jgi:hypothetical protein